MTSSTFISAIYFEVLRIILIGTFPPEIQHERYCETIAFQVLVSQR